MRAVVLVGGQGTRLRPLTLSIPKPMLPIAEVPIIERVVAHLARHDIDEVVLSLGYRPDGFLTAYPENTCAGVRLTYAVEPEPLDTAGGIAFAARHAGIDDTFVVVNGDVLTDLDLSALVAFHRERSATASIALTPVDDPSHFGVVPTDADGRVVAFIEKPPRDEAPTNHINAGFYVFEPEVIDRVPVDGRLHLESKVFPPLADEGRLYALAFDDYWTDTGTPALYLAANLDYLAGRRGTPPVEGAKRHDDSWWTLGAPVVDGVADRDALVADAAFIGSGATVSASVIGTGARVESGAAVRRSVLLPGAVVHADAIVEDSILGAGAIVGRGATVRGLTVVEGGATVDAGTLADGERVAVPA
ncbi:MAG TPA: NDP-sugar synthase [Acidimicrobiales bacterium]|nr:NDP-sugar synthase [Acidimicrobiales bacterium]